ncbi:MULTISPECIES: hypothetical protein [unclassified Sphingomonas]|jgi:hypothetical protein|uniref:hypothetical protein n=1 Tax=unclassified Sphingomonas TaxID=196159 RepID=UPI0008378D06|nr:MULTISPECIES: hypothetical protein [unclassified Sphingomonas]MCH4892926.1 hypothetical protein [Sphingomonas sp. SFZ2018-12]
MSEHLLMELMKPLMLLAALGLTTWLAASWLRGRTGQAGQAAATENAAEIAALRQENERLNFNLRLIEERVEVLEVIATDPARRVAREIETLA